MGATHTTFGDELKSHFTLLWMFSYHSWKFEYFKNYDKGIKDALTRNCIENPENGVYI